MKNLISGHTLLAGAAYVIIATAKKEVVSKRCTKNEPPRVPACGGSSLFDR